jgi:nucleoside-diphosphate-sugar epimerase
MKVFVSGATGFIGARLVEKLACLGYTVHALYRDEKKAEKIRIPGVVLFRGDIMDFESVEKAMSGCSQAYHLAAYAKVWEKNHARIYQLNLGATMRVLRAAINASVERTVVTSTAGIFGPSDGDPVTENASPSRYFIDYEYSKAILEEVLKTTAAAGVQVITVNPSRVYGPGELSESNGVTRMIDKYRKGKWHIIPGNGNSSGNYVYIDDVVQGHILAMQKGVPGKSYILGGENISYTGFFKELSGLTGLKPFMIKVPVPLMIFMATAIFNLARIRGKSPLITPALARKFSHNFLVSSNRAETELGYHSLSLREGLQKTLDWLTNS